MAGNESSSHGVGVVGGGRRGEDESQHPGVGGHAIAYSEDFRKATDYFGVLYDAAALALSAFTAEAIHLNPGNYTVRLSVPILSSSPHPYWIGLEIRRASIVSR
jgi:hypothetical protein